MVWVATGEIVLRPSYRGSSCAGCVGTWRTTGSMERLQEEPTHRHCVGTQCWQGPCWLQLLSECRVWARHPQEWKHTYITLSLGAFVPACCFGNSPSRMCCFHLPFFLQVVADHIPQLVQGVRGSQAQAEDLSAQLALIISSQNFLQVLQQHSPGFSPEPQPNPPHTG